MRPVALSKLPLLLGLASLALTACIGGFVRQPGQQVIIHMVDGPGMAAHLIYTHGNFTHECVEGDNPAMTRHPCLMGEFAIGPASIRFSPLDANRQPVRTTLYAWTGADGLKDLVVQPARGADGRAELTCAGTSQGNACDAVTVTPQP